jgi:hypothetical protein
MRYRLLSFLLPALASLAACSGASDDADPETNGTTEDPLAAIDPADDTDFQDGLSQMYEGIEATSDSSSDAQDAFGAGSIRTQSGLPPLVKKKICAYLKPLMRSHAFEHPYFYVGASLHAAGVVGVIGGVDGVWDLYDQQAATFYYSGRTIETGISVGQTVSAGIGFGAKANVLDAWSGHFDSVGAEVGIPFVSWFSAGLGYFRSPDRSIEGVNGTVSLSQGLTPPVTVAVTSANWTPYDAGTQKLASSFLGFPKYSVEHASVGGRSYAYIQYHPLVGHSAKLGGVGLGAGLIKRIGNNPLSRSAAELAVAIGTWRDTKKSIAAICR